MIIREASSEDITTLAMLISEANQDVATKLGLHAGNCPKHPSLCTDDWITADLARGQRYFIVEEASACIACVAFVNPRTGLAYMNRLSVLPAHRNQGVGTRLVQHIINLSRAASVHTIGIGVIGEHEVLLRWYRKLGFKDGETRNYPHLPFSVKHMSYNFESSENFA
ncbi:MAG: GNAT family N-acetyltransferase [Proteobacteria bacterium]|nr:GNAT family N-acetyltransferase [Pseudomonadota bacterium]